MMEQLDLFTTEPTEQWVYDTLYVPLKAVVLQNNANTEKLCLKEGKSYSSVWIDTQMAFRICCRNGHHYFSVSTLWTDLASEAIMDTITKDGVSNGFTNYGFEPTADGVRVFEKFLCSVLDAAIDSFPKEFDCCSRYEQCSESKKCIHPKPDMAVTCGYRKIMKKGRIFYGGNKTID